MRIQLREHSVILDGYVNAVGRDSRPILDRRSGEKFIEQIVPGTFGKALKRSSNVRILLNHNKNHDLGGTDSNLQLKEDAIGLRAIAEITDAKVIEDAKNGKLRGWSFGFVEKSAYEEDTNNGLKRRYVDDLELQEVSIINQDKIPCYAATSVEVRAEDGDDELIETRELETEAIVSREEKTVDLSKYKKTIQKLGGKE